MAEARYGQQYGRILQPWISSVVGQEIANATDRIYALIALSKERSSERDGQFSVPLYPQNTRSRNTHRGQAISERGSDKMIERINRVINWPTLPLNKRVIVRLASGLHDPSERGSVAITLSDGKHFAYGFLSVEGSQQRQDLANINSIQDSVVIIRKASLKLTSPLCAGDTTKVSELCFKISEYVSIRYPSSLSSTYDPADLSRFDQPIWQMIRLTMYGIPCNPRWKDISFPISRAECCIPKDQMKILGYRIRSHRGQKLGRRRGAPTRDIKASQLQHKGPRTKGLLMPKSFNIQCLVGLLGVLSSSPHVVKVHTVDEPHEIFCLKWFVLPSVRLCLLSTLSAILRSELTSWGHGIIFGCRRTPLLKAALPRPRRRLQKPPASFLAIVRRNIPSPSFNYVSPGQKWRYLDTLNFVGRGLALWVEENKRDGSRKRYKREAPQLSGGGSDLIL